MFGGATPASLLLLLLRMIACGECFCFVHVDKNVFKAYYWTVTHPNFPCKSFLVYLLFRYCLLVEGSNYFYIVSLIVCSVFSALTVSAYKNCLKVGIILSSIKLKTVCHYLLNLKMDITTT